MSIKEYARSNDISVLLDAKTKIEDEYKYSTSSQAYTYLILNHMGALKGINECLYAEAYQYITGDMLNHNETKYSNILQALSNRGYSNAKKDIASEYIKSNPNEALKLYFECLNDPDSNKGEIYENIGYLYFSSDVLDTEEGFAYLRKAADEYNMSFSQFIIASMYFNGEGVDKDIEASFKYCQKAANNGEPHAEYWLGKDYIMSDEYPLEQNVKLGVDYLERAACKGIENAQYYLGVLYYDGDLVPKNVEKAEQWLERAYYQEVPGAFAYLGMIYFDRGEYSEAKRFLEKAHRQYNLFIGMDTLVDIYKNGYYQDPDITKAVYLIEEMIDNGCSNTADITFAADCYYKGLYVNRNYDKAVRYYCCVENDNPKIKYTLGCIALEGKSTLLTKNDCIRYFDYAGNNGYGIAFSKLGNYFISAKNNDRALEYYKKSFNAGNIDDGVMVGRIYEAGTASMYRNMSEAVNWYKAAAEKGSKEAQEELSHIKSTFFGYKRI